MNKNQERKVKNFVDRFNDGARNMVTCVADDVDERGVVVRLEKNGVRLCEIALKNLDNRTLDAARGYLDTVANVYLNFNNNQFRVKNRSFSSSCEWDFYDTSVFRETHAHMVALAMLESGHEDFANDVRSCDYYSDFSETVFEAFRDGNFGIALEAMRRVGELCRAVDNLVKEDRKSGHDSCRTYDIMRNMNSRLKNGCITLNTLSELTEELRYATK